MSCAQQTTKKYTARKSPAYPANECCGKKLVGNDGRPYESRPDKNGVCRWYLVKDAASPKVKAKPAAASSTSPPKKAGDKPLCDRSVTVKALKDEAKSRGLKGYSTLKKAELCKLLGYRLVASQSPKTPPKAPKQSPKAPPKKAPKPLPKPPRLQQLQTDLKKLVGPNTTKLVYNDNMGVGLDGGLYAEFDDRNKNEKIREMASYMKETAYFPRGAVYRGLDVAYDDGETVFFNFKGDILIDGLDEGTGYLEDE